MRRTKVPAKDPLLLTEQGTTRDGQPLTYNRAPAPDLAPWIGRFYVGTGTLPDGYTLACGQFNDAAGLRVQLAGRWEADTRDGTVSVGRSACLFGPQTRRIPTRVTGSFISLGTAIRPGACTALRGPRMTDLLDRVVTHDTDTFPSSSILALFDPQASPEDWILALEDFFRQYIEDHGAAEPDPVSRRFEQIAYASPSMTVKEAGEICGVERRRLERIVLRDFGTTPKQVLRRARALDMASQLRGVADSAEAEEIILRYYDESHLIHEFTQLFGLSPGQFVATPQPLLTLSLEVRQARRMEHLARIAPGEARPWQRPED